ncbi:flagellar filament capping protein FliD [Paenibacillus polymyxa]|uniref:flagellar filament capping protein FliD n=1 Tax=Paenibacillus polymyxa TaxID=1406 RepID=UPI00058A260F|nr:flagellar filament capping protein FliD [Paenibacillus polymyxa]AJE52141.1 flagellar capping protein [Paenibacillus polymyxa]QOH64043.1 flagellar capping protein [Paenibacillus polymyxa]
MRINGFSGMDIDSMVTSLMTAKKTPLNKLNQQKQTLEWTRDSYRELNTKIVQFRAKLFDMGSKSEAMNTQKATLTGNTTAIKAEANADASSTPMSVVVNKLATKSNMQTSTGLRTAGSSTADATKNTTLEQIAGGSASDTYELNINDKTITFLKTDTITAVMARINSEGANVTATFDEISGKFSITAKDYGDSNNIKLTGADKQVKSSTLMDLFQISSTDVKAAEKGEVIVTNTADSSSKTYNPDKNFLVVNGVSLTLLETTGTTGPAKITTQSDPTKAMETIKSFVDTYNDLLSTFNTKLSEQKYRDFPPLTADQRKDMKEDEIKQWEEKAKSGLLKNDTILSSAVSSMRMTISSKLGDLSSIGITTGQYYENGKLQINEEKLKAALTTDPDKVMNIFKGSSADVNSKPIFSELRSKLDTTLDMFVKKAGTSKFDTNASMTLKADSIMGKQLKNYNSDIKEMTKKLADAETRYYKQFSAMESAMSKYQSQSSSLTSFLQ